MIFGSNEIETKPKHGRDHPGLHVEQHREPLNSGAGTLQGSIDFDQRIQLNIWKIGDKIELGTQYTQSLFDFENQMNIGFQGERTTF